MNAEPIIPEVHAFAALAASFIRGGSPCRYGGARHDGRRFYTHGAQVAERLSSTEVWITTLPQTDPAVGKHVASLRRTAISYGMSVLDGPKPPADNSAFAPIPALLRADALLVVEALHRHAITRSGTPATADRLRRLAGVYQAAADGDSPLAAALYLALPPLT